MAKVFDLLDLRALACASLLLFLLLLLAACSDGSGPTGGGGDGRISGLLTSDGLAGQASLAGAEDEEPFTGGAPLRGVTVRLVDGAGNVLFDSQTDAQGGFEIEAPEGTYRLEVTLPDGNTFTIEIEVEAGERLFLQARVRGAGPRPVINVEIFTDDDGDGVSDSGFTIQILGREAGRPDSGERREGRDPDEDLEDEEDDLEDNDRASLEDLQEGQRVHAKGHGTEEDFEANEVHGNQGSTDRFCRLSGFVTGVDKGSDGDLLGLEIFGVFVDTEGARINGLRGGGSALEAGTRVEIHATLAASGELDATQLHARDSHGRDPERVVGPVTDLSQVADRRIEVCGVSVEVLRGAKITNGFGADEDDDDDDEDDDDEETSFEEFVAAVGAGGFNHDARGRFDASDGTLVAEKLALRATPEREIEIIGDVENLNAGAGTFTLLGLPVVVDAGTDFKGGLSDAGELADGLHVKVEVAQQGSVLVALELSRAGEPHDRLRGGRLVNSSSALGSGVNFEVDLGGGLSLPVDADAGTKFEIED